MRSGQGVATMVPSEWTFHNFASDVEISLTPDAEQLLLLFPADIFCRKLLTTKAKVMSFGASAGVPRIAGGFLRLLNSEWQYLSGGEKTDMIYTAAQLVQLAIIEQQTVCRLTMQEALRERVKAYVARNLRAHKLTIEQIASALGCTKRNLHKVFRDDVYTLSAFIWNLRLQRCAADFSDQSRAHESITRIAFSWGFNNAAHFSRLFRERYEVSPSQFRVRAGAGGNADPTEPSTHRRRRTISTDAPAAAY
jgi:AraC-like DNA-binding protein